MPPPGIAGDPLSFFGRSATIASVVISRAAIDAAFCSAARTTLVGSIMPFFIMSTYSPGSALPVAYTQIPRSRWTAFAQLVLQAAYEATMWAAVLNVQRGASNVVLLTTLGGGAFGNDEKWIHDAMWRALRVMAKTQLDVRLVSYAEPGHALVQMAKAFE